MTDRELYQSSLNRRAQPIDEEKVNLNGLKASILTTFNAFERYRKEVDGWKAHRQDALHILHELEGEVNYILYFLKELKLLPDLPTKKLIEELELKYEQIKNS